MGASIERDFEFHGGVYFENAFMMTLYNFTLYMEVNTDSIREQNIAMERLKYLVEEVLDNTVFLGSTDKKLANKFNDCGIKLCILPDEPYDQIIALSLMLKFNAICENKIKILDIKFSSRLSDGVVFNEDYETAKNTFVMNGWWNDSSPCLDYIQSTKKDKIVKLHKRGWNELGLSWKEKKTEPTEIVFSITDTDK